jgi:hypothetical protein
MTEKVRTHRILSVSTETWESDEFSREISFLSQRQAKAHISPKFEQNAISETTFSSKRKLF